MDLVDLLTFLLVAALLVISPGPNGVLIAKTVPISGRKAGLANVWGFVSAFYVHGTLSVLGISVLLVQSSEAFRIFKMLGAAYLFWIGIKSILAAWRSERRVPTSPSKSSVRVVSTQGAFIEGFLTNVLNPKVSIFYLAAFPQFLSVEERASQAYILISLHALINLLWFSTIVFLLSKLRNIANSARLTKWLRAVTGAVFVGFGTKLALSRPLSDG